MSYPTLYFLPVCDGGDPLKKSDVLEFIPHAGLMIDPGEGNYRKVEQVFFKNGALTVWFEEDEEQSRKTLREWGWKNK